MIENKVYVPTHFLNDHILVEGDDLIIFNEIPILNNEYTVFVVERDNQYFSYQKNIVYNQSQPFLTSNQISDNFMYRDDIVDISIMTFALILVVILVPLKIVSRFGKWITN